MLLCPPPPYLMPVGREVTILFCGKSNIDKLEEKSPFCFVENTTLISWKKSHHFVLWKSNIDKLEEFCGKSNVDKREWE